MDFWLQSVYTYTAVLDSSRTDRIKKSSLLDKTEGDVPSKQSEEKKSSYKSPPIFIVGTHCGNLQDRVSFHIFNIILNLLKMLEYYVKRSPKTLLRNRPSLFVGRESLICRNEHRVMVL